MSSESTSRERKLAHFASYEAQELDDLRYGAQAAWCEALASTVPNAWTDASIERSWTPDED